MANVLIEPHRPDEWSGPWPPPYYREFVEFMCADELHHAGLFPIEPSPIRIDRLIEKNFNLQIEPRSDLPKKHPGLTIFSADGRPAAMFIDRSLEESDDPAAQRRARSTLAHEAGHALLHGEFFVHEDIRPKPPASLGPNFGFIPHAGRANYVWMEWQANHAIGGFLVPEPLVRRALESFLVWDEIRDRFLLDVSQFAAAVEHLCSTFDVNPSLVRLRLKHLFSRTDRIYPHWVPYDQYGLPQPDPEEERFRQYREDQARAIGLSDWRYARQRSLLPSEPLRRDEWGKRLPEPQDEARRLRDYWAEKENDLLEETIARRRRERKTLGHGGPNYSQISLF